MERAIKRFYYNVSSNRVVVTIRSYPCEPDSVQARMALAEIFQNCVNNPEFLNCDTKFFEKATLIHDGQRWVFTAEAIVPKEDE